MKTRNDTRISLELYPLYIHGCTADLFAPPRPLLGAWRTFGIPPLSRPVRVEAPRKSPPRASAILRLLLRKGGGVSRGTGLILAAEAMNLDRIPADGASSAAAADMDDSKTSDAGSQGGAIWDEHQRRGAMVFPMIELRGVIDYTGISVVVVAATTESGCTWWFGAESGLPCKSCPFGEKTCL